MASHHMTFRKVCIVEISTAMRRKTFIVVKTVRKFLNNIKCSFLALILKSHIASKRCRIDNYSSSSPNQPIFTKSNRLKPRFHQKHDLTSLSSSSNHKFWFKYHTKENSIVKQSRLKTITLNTQLCMNYLKLRIDIEVKDVKHYNEQICKITFCTKRCE